MGQNPPGLLDQLLARYIELPEDKQIQIAEQAKASVGAMKFIPNPGPQTMAWHCQADVLLYGGEGGGGKSGLLLGLALQAHDKSLLMRRKYTDLAGLTDDAVKLNKTREGYNASPPPKLRTEDGRLIEFGAMQREEDIGSWMGRAHDLLGIDEAWQFTKNQVRTLMGWVRSTKPGQRCRVVLATNPPLSSDGAWLVEMFAPWVDPYHPNPAAPGELRWYITEIRENDFVDHEVSGPGKYIITMDKETGGQIIRPPTIEEDTPDNRDVTSALSRTFIRARVDDNPFLSDTDYRKMLDSLPEPVRSSVRDGNFMAARKDDDWQAIPTNWVLDAQKRWTNLIPQDVPQCAIGADAAGGGSNDTVLAPRHDGYFSPLIVIPGKDTPYGAGISGRILAIRHDGAAVGIDMDGGWGNVPFNELRANDIDVTAYKGSEGSVRRTKDGIYGYANKRAQSWWGFREALDPNQLGGSSISLPPDPHLVAELTALRYKLVTHKGRTCIQLEDKKEASKRLGRSPDRADAVIISYAVGPKAGNFQGGWQGRAGQKRNVKVNTSYAERKRRR